MMEIDLERYDHSVYIVGGGPSLKTFDWSLLNDKFVIAINTAYTKVSENAEAILYFTDNPWAAVHIKNLEKFKGLIYQGTLTPGRPAPYPFVDAEFHLTGVEGLETKEGCLKHGSSSAYAATNLAAVHLGFKRINLLGIDMQYGVKNDKSTSHWHSQELPHLRIDPPSVFSKMLINWKSIVTPLKNLGVEVINVNTPEGTALKEFPIKSVEEVFNLTVLKS